MNSIHSAGFASFVLIAAFGNVAHAQTTGLTRAEVKQATLEAIRTGDIAGPGDTDLTLRQLFPSQYPPVPTLPGRTRDAVKSELSMAVHEGNVAEGDLQETPRELEPSRFPLEPMIMQATRAEIKAELKEAIRTGDIDSIGDVAEPLNQLFPTRYPMQASKAIR